MSSAVTAKGERMSGTDIFLSYARSDRAAAKMFAEAFIAEGFSVWWDAVLHSGETFDEVIEQRLRDAAAVVVLWSPRSVASRWVRAEATQADRRRKLAPAIIEPCDRPIIFELTHAADLCEWTGDITDIRWRTFVDDLRHLIEARAREAAAASQTPALVPAAPAHAQPPRQQTPVPQTDEVILGRNLPEAPLQAPHGGKEHDARAVDGSEEVHCLEMEENELPDDLFVIDSSGVKIGRVAPADVVLAHRSISREHCIVGLANDELLVTDLNSTNGTYIDDTRIRRAAILPVGSTLRLGQISLTHAIRTRAEALARANAIGAASLQAGRLALTS
jgi:hypothetical protein